MKEFYQYYIKKMTQPAVSGWGYIYEPELIDLFNIQALAGEDKPRPYRRKTYPGGKARFILARQLAWLI